MPENAINNNNANLSSKIFDTINLIKQLDRAKKDSDSPPKYCRYVS